LSFPAHLDAFRTLLLAYLGGLLSFPAHLAAFHTGLVAVRCELRAFSAPQAGHGMSNN